MGTFFEPISIIFGSTHAVFRFWWLSIWPHLNHIFHNMIDHIGHFNP